MSRQQPTSRQLDVLRLVADGNTNAEIARRLHLSVETVKTHLAHLFAALGARDRAHAVHIGWQRGHIPATPPPRPPARAEPARGLDYRSRMLRHLPAATVGERR